MIAGVIAWVVDGLSWICLLGGGFFVLVGGVGMLRFPDLFTRLHATSVTETLGAGLLLLGMLLQAPGLLVAVKLLLLTLFLFVTSATAAHALAKAALHGGMLPYGEDLIGDTVVAVRGDGRSRDVSGDDGDDEPDEETTILNPRTTAAGEEPSSNR